jgi:transcription-repair coupling factor (superfamily II helicase)
MNADIFEFLENDFKKESLGIICADEKEAQLCASMATFLGFTPFVLPDIRATFGEDLRSYQDELFDLFATLKGYYGSQDKKIVIAPLRTTLLPLPKEECFDSFEVAFGEKIGGGIKEKLYAWGYEFVDIVADRGEVSFRGDIIDIFPIDREKAIRISLFDEDVESIREFDISSQKSDPHEFESITILPAFLALSAEEFETLLKKANNASFDVLVKDINSIGLWLLEERAWRLFDWDITLYGTAKISDEMSELESSDALEQLKSIAKIPEAKRYKEVEVVDVNKFLKTHANKKITIIAKDESLVRGSILENFDGVEFVYQEGIFNLMSSDRLILSLNKPLKNRRVKKSNIVLDELKPGDYVVHENYGVGLFSAVEKREVLGSTREFVVIRYQGEDQLLVPVENLEVIDRYIAEGGSLPIIDRLGKASFRHLKERLKEKLFAIAAKIIQLSAERHLKAGIIIKAERALQEKFIADAGFFHTSDQEDAIRSILDELSSGRIMDRLLSADVGFGKTEVAMNTMFAVAKSGYQAVIIAPTTLLSSQHYKSLKERFDPYGISVGKLDRFTTAKEKTAIKKRAKEGSIDIVVGTHALLGVEFAKLAFVVIDEEHKFGVKQKEKLKEMASDVHLLSMSATPIPRSLNMALSKIKTFSEIFTPPLERLGVRTFVKSFDKNVIKEAINREIRRGGQIFYVHNSIAALKDKKKELLEILPKLKIAILHSQISAKESEEEMIAFEAGEYDVLLSTTIVESGIHLPSANTMIVDGAENFGLADLHQLRGRVGRGKKEGYCYFIVKDKDVLSDNAKKRLLALESHSELGSGAILAFHDLEIRGGGNLIGEAQSGHIKQIGYGLYLRMLEDAIRELSGQAHNETKSVEMKLSVSAYLNEDLISEDRLRLELYRRLSLCESVGEVYEIESEIADRFGKPDSITRQFIDIIAMKVMAKDVGVSKVSSYGENVFIEFEDENKERVVLKSPSKDDDDIITTAFGHLKNISK